MFAAKCTITTRAVVPAVRFPKFEYRTDSTYVLQCALSCEEADQFIAEIELTGVPHASSVEDIALSVNRQALLRLEGTFGLLCGPSECKIDNLRSLTNPGDDIPVGRGTVQSSRSSSGLIVTHRTPHELRGMLEQERSVKDAYLELYHFARSAPDHVVQFLGHYQIVAGVLHEPGQAKIDRFFIANDNPLPDMTPRPDHKGTLETVYSRLRNEVAHVRMRDGSNWPKDAATVREEIALHVHRLARLAKIAIASCA